MKSQYSHYLVAIFAVFLGSQITEGVLLVPYWQSLSASEFYAFYQNFGPSIGRFYTFLTIIAALVPIVIMISCFLKKSKAFPYALASTIFAVLFLVCFYIYFKGINELFYQSAFSEEALKMELIRWNKWHWGRIGLEFLSLLFLILTFQKMKEA